MNRWVNLFFLVAILLVTYFAPPTIYNAAYIAFFN